ncbi:hypothetical protein EON65_29205, partial [archaeon]
MQSPRVIGIACSFSPTSIPIPSSSTLALSPPATSTNPSPSVLVFPYAQYFSQTPTLGDLLTTLLT